MKNLSVSTFLFFTGIHFGIAQDLGVLSTTVYTKADNDWSLVRKSEYSIDPMVEKKTSYKWEENAWQKDDEWIRTFSADKDTIILERNYWEGTEMVSYPSQVCYNVRDQQNDIVNLVVDGRPRKRPGTYSNDAVNFDLTQECMPIS